MTLPDTSWMRQGTCREAPKDFMFPEDGAGVELAKQVCARCPVRQVCDDYAFAHPTETEFGVWGGRSARERARMRAARNRAKRSAA